MSFTYRSPSSVYIEALCIYQIRSLCTKIATFVYIICVCLFL